MKKRLPEPESRTTHLSIYQDFALALCIKSYGVCPYGNAKDGSPNCHHFVQRLECEPGRLTHDEAEMAKKWREDASK